MFSFSSIIILIGLGGFSIIIPKKLSIRLFCIILVFSFIVLSFIVLKNYMLFDIVAIIMIQVINLKPFHKDNSQR